MARRRKRQYYKLTNRQCHNAPPGRHADGLGLYLDVRLSGSRAWVQRVVVDRIRRDIGLGGFPTVTLEQAREQVLENRRLIRQGVDPFARRLEQKGVPTIRELVPIVIAKRKKSWRGSRTEASWLRSFKDYVFPLLGDIPVNGVTLTDIERVVEPHWDAPGTAGHLVRQRLDVLFRHAVVHGYCSKNHAHDLLELLSPVRREPVNRPSLPHEEVRTALELVRESAASEVVKEVLLFIVLTAARLTEATGALWSEIDFNARVWHIPGSRMKAGFEHDVPLSKQAIALLHRVHVPNEPFVFRFRRPDGQVGPVTGDTLNYWIRKFELRDSDGRIAVVHGFRASFAGWHTAVAAAPSEAREAALAHRGSALVRAYLRKNPLFDVRVELMQDWADYVVPR